MVRLGFLALAFAAFVAREPVVNLRLEAPFDELFQTSKTTPDYAVDGMLSDGTGAPGPVKISVRGHTSRRETECVFPKLKVQRADGTTLRLGTHCGEATGDKLSAKYGRLPNEKSPWREVAIYQILDALGVPALRAKAARVTYLYPGRPQRRAQRADYRRRRRCGEADGRNENRRTGRVHHRRPDVRTRRCRNAGVRAGAGR
jgi:hypothetical protein